MTTTIGTPHTAAIGTAPDVVTGDNCDLSIITNERSYNVDADGNDITEWIMTSDVAMDAVDLDVRTDDPDKLVGVQSAADEILASRGWTRVEQWQIADNAMYAYVERDSE